MAVLFLFPTKPTETHGLMAVLLLFPTKPTETHKYNK